MHKNSFRGLAPPGPVRELTAIHPTLWLDLGGEGPSGKRREREADGSEREQERKGEEERGALFSHFKPCSHFIQEFVENC